MNDRSEKRVKHKMLIPKEINELFELFKNNNFKLFIVGGAVRDTVLGNEIKDFDLATDAQPSVVENILNSNGIRTIGTGASFGVINAFINNEEFEIATFRTDSEGSDGRRPDSVSFTDMSTDVKRRDLTINALFYDIETNEIVDLVGGIDDINNGVVRAVGDAEKRFNEDRLRVLRAIRFAGRFGSDLDLDIDKSLVKNNSLKNVSSERIRDEFIKGIKSAKSTKHFLSLIDKYNLFDAIFKDLKPINKDFVESNNEIIVLSKLLSDIPHNVIAKSLNQAKYSSNEIRGIVFMVKFSQSFNRNNFYELKKMHSILKLSNDVFRGFSEVMGINARLVDKFINFEFTITGNFIMDGFKIKAGPELGNKIKWLETNKFFSE